MDRRVEVIALPRMLTLSVNNMLMTLKIVQFCAILQAFGTLILLIFHVRTGEDSGKAGVAYLQCAAVTTQSCVMTLHPHQCACFCFRRSQTWMLHCQGHECGFALSPPIMRLVDGRTPHFTASDNTEITAVQQTTPAFNVAICWAFDNKTQNEAKTDRIGF